MYKNLLNIKKSADILRESCNAFRDALGAVKLEQRIRYINVNITRYVPSSWSLIL